MASKYQMMHQLLEDVANDVSFSGERWEAFLKSAAWMYKYSFEDQLLIYAQKPTAKACAEFEVWNQKVHRWVNKGAKGIALLGEHDHIRYVFDVADTNHPNNIPFQLWSLQGTPHEQVIQKLENYYGESSKETFQDSIKEMVQHMVMDNISDYTTSLLQYHEYSQMDGMSEDEITLLLSNAVYKSVLYQVFERLQMDVTGSFDYENKKFDDIVFFNTPDTIFLLGKASSDMSENILSQIALATKQVQQERNIRTFANMGTIAQNKGNDKRRSQYERNHVSSSGRLSNTKLESREGDTSREIWTDEKQLSEEHPSRILSSTQDFQPIEQSSTRNSNTSGSNVGNFDKAETEVDEEPGAEQGNTADGVGSNDELVAERGGGSYSSNDYLQLNLDVGGSDDVEEIVPPFDLQDVPAILRDEGSLTGVSKEDVVQYFHNHPSSDDRREYLREYLYAGALQVYRKRHEYDYEYVGYQRNSWDKTIDSIELYSGNYLAKKSSSMVDLEYFQATIATLIEKDEYLQSPYEKMTRLQRHIHNGNINRDVDRILFSHLDNYTVSSAEIIEAMQAFTSEEEKEAYVKTIFANGITLFEIDEVSMGIEKKEDELYFFVGNHDDPSLEYHYKWWQIAHEIDGLILSRYFDSAIQIETEAEQKHAVYASLEALQKGNYFSQEEVDRVLTMGSGVSQGKFRIYEYLSKDGNQKDDVAFLKQEYGIGGRTTAVGHISEDHNAKGITLSKGYIGEYESTVTLSWSSVRKRIKELIAINRYVSKAEEAVYVSYLANTFVKKSSEEVAHPAFDIKEESAPLEYRYELGDRLHIGIDEHEVIVIKDGTIGLRDVSFPLFSKEYQKAELDAVVAENPLNEHLLKPVQEKEMGHIDHTSSIQAIERMIPWKQYYQDTVNELLDNIQNHWSYDSLRDRDMSEDEAFDLLNETVDNFIINGRGSPYFNNLYVTEEEFKNVVLEELFDKTYNDVINQTEVVTEVAHFADDYERYLLETSKNTPHIVSSVNHTDTAPIASPKEEIPQANYRIHDDNFQVGTPKERYQHNVAAIQLLFSLEEEQRNATVEEQEILARYVGWGGLADVFDETKSSWSQEYREVKNLLTEHEYTSARESTLTAFYTAPIVAKAMYQAIENMGFRYGNILEPSCATGNFLGMLPDALQESKLYGIELDVISGRIAQKLYPKSNIVVGGYENVDLPDSFFDVAIGNIPFGQFKVNDKRYDKLNYRIHDYFFAKTMDKVRPGGIIAFITSRFTMDKENASIRNYINERAELIGAIRLPNSAFKSAAGTKVVSDILFLQKRERPSIEDAAWLDTEKDALGNTINSYFVKNPEMVLGTIGMTQAMYGRETLDVLPYEDISLEESLQGAIMNIHTQMEEYLIDESLDTQEEVDSIPADFSVRNFSYTVHEDEIYYRENSIMRKINTTVTSKNRMLGLIEIRESVRELIRLQTEDASDYEIKKEQAHLNNLYDNYITKYGLINARGNSIAFRDDSSYFLLTSLEILDEDGNLKRKADMFYKRTIRKQEVIERVDTALEALPVSLAEKGKVDIAFMASLCDKQEAEVLHDLHGIVFEEPFLEGMMAPERTVYLTSDEYLSGNIREKLVIAKAAFQLDEKYKGHVEALEQALPEPLAAAEISVRIGATWIGTEDYRAYIFELLETSRYNQSYIDVLYSKEADRWNIKNKSYDRGNVKAEKTYGTSRVNAYKLIEDCLNLKSTKIYDQTYDEVGNKISVLNKKETMIAQQKQDAIKEAFKEWIWSDGDRRERLSKKYNELFNSIRPREYNGEHLTFPNMNPEIKFRKHQLDGVARTLYGNNVLLAHVVGAGKTYTMAAAAMELKRLGISHKQMFVVPNHLVGQWGSEFLQLYPSANVLVATKKDFQKNNRKRFCSRIATGEFDAIIIGHSTFEKIPMSIERQRLQIENEIDAITKGLSDLKANQGERFTVKQLERTKKSLKNRLDKLNDDSRKDDVICFEELGVDRLFVDEAHNYKNLFLYTKMSNVAGLSQSEAQKSSDLFMKCRYLDEITGNKGVVFATGTPISNSMTELYTMQRYLQYNTLRQIGLENFDAWASTFGETINAIELTPEGKGYRMKTRFAKFYNLPELISIFKEAADIKTADMLHLPVPKANYHSISVKPSEIQKEIVENLADRAEEIRTGDVDPSEDNMLKIVRC